MEWGTKMKASVWPFRPIHITNDGEKQHDGDIYALTGVGIISNEHLKGIETEICANLDSPTTLIEFSPTGNPIRTDSKLLQHSLRPPCRVFRECTKARYCHQSDNHYALLLRDLSKAKTTSLFVTRGLYAEDLGTSLGEPNSVPRLCRESTTGQFYLEYDCPLLGYRELLFPVFFDDRVIAVLFIGQACLKSNLSIIKETQGRFFRENPCEEDFQILIDQQGLEGVNRNFPSLPIPNSVQHAHNPSGYRNLEDLVTSTHDEWIADRDHILTAEKYEMFIKECCREVGRLQGTLREQMELQREQYVRTCVTQRINDFHKRLTEGLIDKSKESVDTLWQILWDALEQGVSDLVSDFDLDYAVVFGTKDTDWETGNTLPLHVVVSTHNTPIRDISHLGEVSLIINVPNGNIQIQVPANSTGMPIHGHIEGWLGDISHYDIRLTAFNIPLHPQLSNVILIGYKPSNPSNSSDNVLGGYLNTSLQSFYNVAAASISSILAISAQTKVESSLRVFGHEMGQLTSGLDWLRLAYLTSPERLRALSDEKASDINRDITGYLEQIQYLSLSARMVLGIPTLTRERFLAFREILFKWKDIYRLEAKAKNLDISVYNATFGDPIRPPIDGDKKLLEMLIYNLVNNAVKYSYRGTKIYIDCRKLDNKMQIEPKKALARTQCCHIIVVVDYGNEMLGNEELYGLYRRGSNVSQTHEGLGIGLYVAKKIALAHGGILRHTSEKISEFNVPLMEAYLALDQGQEELKSKILKEIDRLKKTGDYNYIIAKYENGKPMYVNPSREELINSIQKPIFKVTLFATIPEGE
jgi:signal transduction histidine kinase